MDQWEHQIRTQKVLASNLTEQVDVLKKVRVLRRITLQDVFAAFCKISGVLYHPYPVPSDLCCRPIFLTALAVEIPSKASLTNRRVLIVR